MATRARTPLGFIDLAVPGILFSSALVVRLLEANLIPFPALDDPAFYLKVAENLATGQGLVIDAIWNYQVPFAQVLHPSNEHWMPLTSLVLAPFFALFGSSYKLAQVVGAFFGSLLVLVAWHTARATLSPRGPWRGTALFVTALVAFNPLLIYQSATVDSATYFGLSGSLALLLAARRSDRGPGSALVIGLLAGLAFLARSDGLLLGALLLGWTWFHGTPATRASQTGCVLLGFALVAGPWLARNALTFGTPFPSSALALALLPDYPTLFHYGGASYWNGLPSPDVGQLLGLRVAGLAHNLVVLLMQSLFPIAPLAIVGFLTIPSSRVVTLGVLFGSMLLLVSGLLFPVPTLYGTFYHSIGAVLPILTVLAVVGLQRFGQFIGRRLFDDPDFMPVLLGMAVFVLVLIQLGLSAAAAAELHGSWQQEFTQASQWLKEHGARTVMTTQPHSLHYASGLPAVMLPVGDPPEVALEVARRYGADYVVGFGSFGRYPDALQGDAFPAFSLAFEDEGVWIYRVQ